MFGTDSKSWHPQPKVYKSPPYTVEISGVEKKQGETIPRRNVQSKDALREVPEEGIETVFDIIKRGSSKFGNAKAVGWRTLVRTHDEVKKIKKTVDGKETSVDKKWTYFELSEYTYRSFIEYERMCLRCGAGLRKLGMSKDDRLHIFAATSPFWLSMAHGAASQSMPIVTAYDSLGEEGLRHSMEQTKAKAIFLDPALLPKLVKPLDTAKSIQHVIYNSLGEVKQEHIDQLKKAHPHLTITSYDELQELGKANPVDPVPPSREDLCCIMYTSGSTGSPKGVLLKHKNVLAAISGVDTIVGPYLGPGDGLLTYLPLAHILEFVFENACIFWGGTMGYGNAKTISDQSVRNCKGDIREFRPTIMVGVPAVFESIKKGITARVNGMNPVVRNLFWATMQTKSLMMTTGLPGASILDHTILKSVKEATGGKLRICMNGGGPVAKDTHRFISLAIAPLIIGYGLTETAAMGGLMDPAAWTDSAIGELPTSVEAKLVDFPDAGYLSTNNPPQGEIWLRGASIANGYLDLEEETKEAFTEDGWFKSGDIGQFDSSGNLHIIDRKKNLVKTLNGEYIALEKLESTYRSCHVVGNICVYASPEQSKPIAIIVPGERPLKELASSNGIDNDYEQLCQNDKVQSLVLKQMQNTGRSAGLQGIEIIDGIVLADEEWTPQNGLVTSAQKLNRKGILQKYQKEVDAAYAKNS